MSRAMGSRRATRKLVAAAVAAACVGTAAVTAAPATGASTPNAYRLSVTAGRYGLTNGGPEAAQWPSPSAVDVDASGNIYFADRRGYIAKVAPGGTLTIIAGNGNAWGTPVAGKATASPISPADIAVDAAHDVYIADSRGYVEKVKPDGTLSIVGGQGGVGGDDLAVGRPATESRFEPAAIAVDAHGDVYVGTTDDDIVRIAPDDTLTILGGNQAPAAAQWGGVGYIGVNGIAVAPSGDPVYISAKDYIFKLSGGTISTFAGDGSSNQQNWPAGLPATGAAATSGPINATGVALDASGNVYFADGRTVGRITPTGTATAIARHVGGGDPAAGQSSTMLPTDVAVDHSGNVLIADDAGFIDKLSTTGRLSTVVGDPTPYAPRPGRAMQSPMSPRDVAYDAAGNLYVADRNGYLEKVTPAGTLSVLAGNGDSRDKPIAGPAKSSPLNPRAVTVDSAGNLYAASGAYIVKVTRAGVLSILAGDGEPGYDMKTGPATDTGVDAAGLAVDKAGNVYLANPSGYIARITRTGYLTIEAGNGNDVANNPSEGPGLSVAMIPVDVAVDATGDVLIANYGGGVSKLTPAGNVVRVPGSNQLDSSALTVDSTGNVYVVDGRSASNEYGVYVDKLTPDGHLSVIAGNGDTRSGPVAGWATSSPMELTGIAVTGAGRVAVADPHGGWIGALDAKATTVPSAPANVSATAWPSAALVTFDAAYDTGGQPITGYTVSDGHGHTCSPTTLLAYGAGRMACAVNGLPPGTPPTFTVVAENANGSSRASAASRPVTP